MYLKKLDIYIYIYIIYSFEKLVNYFSLECKPYGDLFSGGLGDTDHHRGPRHIMAWNRQLEEPPLGRRCCAGGGPTI